MVEMGPSQQLVKEDEKDGEDGEVATLCLQMHKQPFSHR